MFRRNAWRFAELIVLPAALGGIIFTAGCGGTTDSVDRSGDGSTATATVDAGSSDDDRRVNNELQGKIVIDGSSTVYPITVAVATRFNNLYPNVQSPAGRSGTGGGFKRFSIGETDVQGASRPIKKSEFDIAKENKAEFIELPVAYDGLTIVVHKDNDWVDQLTVDDLKKIFTADIAAKNWSDVRDGWPEKEIKIYAPGTDSGTFDYFKEVVAGKTGSIRQDISPNEDDNVLVTGVAKTPNAIGFFGVSYYEENRDKLRAVPIVNKDGDAVLPDAELIENGTYNPFSRPLFVYVNAESMMRPEVETFVMYYLDVAPEEAARLGYVALPSEVYQLARSNAEDLNTGTYYLDEAGEKIEGPVTEVFSGDPRTGF